MLLHSVYTLLVSYGVWIHVVASDSVTLDVSGEAVPIDIPGVYIVPVSEDVTFTCNSSVQAIFPFWRVDLKVLGNTTGFADSTQVSSLPSVSSRGGRNPTSFTVHNLSPKSNGSFVECMAGFSIINATILVEGSPNCPNTQIGDITKDSLVVSVQQLHRMWLPVCYHVNVTSYNMSVVTEHNLSSSGDGSVPVTSLQPGTVYNISVTPCNMAGCNRSCEIHSERTAAVPTGGVLDPGSGAVGDPFLTIGLPIIVVAVLTILTVLATIIPLTLFYRRRRLRGKQKKGGTERGGIEDKSRNTTEYAEIVPNATPAKGNSLQGPAKAAYTRAPGASPMEYSTVQDAVFNSQQNSTKTATLPPISPPPPPPCTPGDVAKCFDADNVQDAGYATVPQSQGSKRITKVRGTQRNTNQKCADSVDSSNNSVKV